VEAVKDVDEKFIYIIVQKEVTLSSLLKEEEMMKLFHIIIQVKNNKVDALFDDCP
jgi:hypothetical protein